MKTIFTISKKLLSISFFLSVFFISTNLYAASRYWVGGANAAWNVTSSWSDVSGGAPGATVPAAADDVYFDSNSGSTTITVTSIPTQAVHLLSVTGNIDVTLQAATTNTLSINGASSTNNIVVESGSILQLSATNTLTVTIVTTVSQSGDISGTLNVNAGTFTTSSVASTVVTVSSSGIINNNGGTITSSAATLVFASGATFNHARNGGAIPVASWNAASNCNITGITVTNPTGFSGAFGNVTWNCTGQTSATGAISGAMTVNGNLTISSGTFADGGYVITGNASGIFTIASGATYTTTRTATSWFPTNFTAGNISFDPNGIFNYAGTIAHTIPASPVTSYGILAISGSGIKTLSAVTTVVGLNINSGTLSDGGYAINGSGTLNIASGAALTLGTAATATGFPTGFATVNLNTASTVTYNSNSAQNISNVPTYGNLTLSATAAVIKSLQANTTVAGNLAIGANNTFNLNGYNINIAGNYTNSGTLNASAATSSLTLNGSAAQTFSVGTYTATLLSNLIIENTFSATGATVNTVTVGNLIINPGGYLTINNITITVKNNVVNDGNIINTAAQTSATINMNGTVAQTISGSGTWAVNGSSPLLHRLTINNSLGVDLQMPLGLYSALTLTAGSLSASGSGTLTMGAGVTSTLLTTRTNGSLALTPSFNLSGVTYNVTYGIATAGINTGNELPPAGGDIVTGTMTVGNSNAAGVILAADVNVNNVTVTTAGYVLNLNGFTLGIAGSYSNTGTLTANAANSAILLNGSAAQTFTVGTYTGSLLSNLIIENTFSTTGASVNTITVGNIIVNAGGYFTPNNAVISVKNNIVNNGNIINTAAQTSAAINMNGTVAQTISGSGIWAVGGVSPLMQKLTVANTSGGVDIQMPTGIYSALTLTSEVLSASGSGSLTMGAGSASTCTMTRTGGSLSLSPIWNLSGVTFNVIYGTGASVSFSAGNEIPDAATTAITGNFTMNTSATGTVSLTKNITVNGTWTNSSGIFSIGANTLTLNSTVTMTAGNFIGGASSDIAFGGSGNAALLMNNTTPGTTNVLQNLTVDHTSGNVTITSVPVIVNNTLTLSAGVLAVNSQTLTLKGSVTGSGTLSGTGNLILNSSLDGSMGTINLTSGAQTFTSLTMNGTGTSPTVIINGNLTVASYTLTSGVVNMGNFNLINTGNASTMPSTAGSASGYFAFLGSSGGFQWNMPASTAAGTYRWPIGPAGIVSGFRPVTVQTTSSNPASIVNVKFGFIDHDGSAYYSPTNVLTSGDIRANYIAKLTYAGTSLSAAPHITMTYQDADFNTIPSDVSAVTVFKHNGTQWATLGAQTSNGTADGNITITKNTSFTFAAGTYPLVLAETINDPGSANTWYWVGGTSVSWSTASNWLPASVPNAATANVIINNPSATFQPALNQTAAVNDISVGTGCSLTTSGTVTLTIYGVFSNNGSVTPVTASTFNYAGSASQTILPLDYFTLISSGTGDRVLSPADTTGVATLFTPGSNTYTTANSTVSVNGTQTFTYTSGFQFYNLIINAGNLTLAANSGITINNDLTINSGSTLFDAATALVSGPGSSSGTFTMNGTATFTMVNPYTTTDPANAGSFPIFSAYAFSPTSTVNFNGAAAQPVYAVPAPGYGNISTTTNPITNAKTAAGSFTIQGNLNVANATSAFYDDGNNITVNGNITNNGTINGAAGSAGSGKIILLGSVAQTLLGAGTNYGNLEIYNTHPSGVTFTGTATALLNVNGSLTVSTGSLFMGNFTTGIAVAGNLSIGDGANASSLSMTGTTGTRTFNSDFTVNTNASYSSAVAATVNINGNIQNSGTINSVTAGTYTLGGTGDKTINVSPGSPVTMLTTVNITNTSGFTNYTDLTVNSLGGAGKFIAAANSSLTLGGTGSGNVFSTTTVDITTNVPNTVTYSSSAAQTARGTLTYYNLTVNKSAGTATLGGAVSVTNNLTVENGTFADGTYLLSGPGSSAGIFSINNSAVFTMTNTSTNTTAYNIGSFPIFSVYDFDTTSTVNYNANSAQPVAAVTYGNLGLGTISTIARTKTAQGSFEITGNYSNNSTTYITFALGDNNTITFDGTVSTGNITGFAGTTSNIVFAGTVNTNFPAVTNGLNDLTVNKPGGTVTMTGAQTVAGILSLTDGIFNVANQSLTLNGTVAPAGSGTISSVTNNGVLVFSGSAGGDFGTLNLTGGAQTFNTLSFSRGGTTPSATINGNLTLASNSAGAFTMNSNGGVLNMNGDLYLSGTTAATFTFSNGMLNMGNNTFTYNSTRTNLNNISSSATKYIYFLGSAGGFQWNMPAGTAAGTSRFPIGPAGDVNGFRPITFQTLAANPASVTGVKAGFINHDITGTQSPEEIPTSGNNRAGYIANITVSGGVLPPSNITMAYQDADFNAGSPAVTEVAIYRHNGSDWSRVGQSSNSTADGNITVVKNSVNVSGAQPYALGVTGGADLPGNTYVWVGGTSSAWDEPSNWDLNNGSFPNDAADNVVIDNTYSPINWPIIPNSVIYVVNNISVSAPASLTIGAGTLGELDVWGDFSNTGSVTGSAGSTVKFMSASPQDIPPADYYNLVCNGGAGARTFSPSDTVGIAGVLTLGANSYTTTGSTINFNGSGNQTIPTQPSASFYNNLCVATGGIKSLQSATTVNGDITVFSGAALADASYILTGPGSSSGKTFTLKASGIFTVTNTVVAYVFPSFQFYSLDVASTVNYNAASANQQISAVPSPYGNLSLAGAATKTAGGSFTVEGDFTNGGTGFSLGANTITFNGLLAGAGAWTGGASSNIIFGGNGAATTLRAVTNGLNNLTVNRANGINLSGAVTVAGALDLADGPLTVNAGVTLTLNGSVVYSAPATGSLAGTGTSVLVIGGATGGNLGTLNFSGAAPNLGTMTVNRTGASPSVELGTPLTIQSALNLTSGDVTAGTGSLTVGIPATNFSTVRSLGSLAFIPNFDFTSGAYNITYNGTAQTYTVLNELPPASVPTNGILTVSLATNVVVLDKNANIGRLITSVAGATMDLNSYTLGLSLSPAVTNSGTLTANAPGSTLMLNGSTAQTVAVAGTYTGTVIDSLIVANTGATATMSGSFNVNNLKINSGASFSLGSASYSLGLSGSYSNAGTLTANGTGATLEFKGSAPQTFDVGNYTSSVITVFKVSNSGGGVTLGAPVNAATLNLNAAGSALTTSPANILTVTGTAVANIVLLSGSYVNGPLARTLPASLSAAATYTFPVGKTYNNLLELINPTTTSAGTLIITVEAFDANPGGTDGFGFSSANNPPRYWQASSSGAGVLSSVGALRLLDNYMGGISSANVIGNASALAGTYNTIGGVSFNSPLSGNISSAYTVPVSLGFFKIGERAVLSGNYTIGSGGDFSSLTNPGGLFDLINISLLSGDVTALIISDLTDETGVVALSQWTETGTGNYTLTIQPDNASLKTISNGTVANGAPMIPVNGADRFIIDGNFSGAGKYLLFRNTNAAPANTGAVIQFNNTSADCYLKNCIIESNASAVTCGQLILGATGANSSITVSGNDFRDATAGTTGSPANAIYSNNASNASITVSANNIYNWTGTGILFTAAGNSNNITGNSFFNTQSPTTAQTAINIANTASNNNTISGNFIGGQAASCGGNSWNNSGSAAFTAINLNVGTTTPTSVQNNTIKNIYLSSAASAAAFTAINVSAGLVNIGNITANSIGDPAVPNSLRYDGQGVFTGIKSASASSVNISNNILGNLHATNNVTATAQLVGISTTAGINTISGNSLSYLINDALNTNTGASSAIIGISQTSTAAGQTISANSISALSNSSNTQAVRLIGIHYTGATTGSNLTERNLIHSFDFSSPSAFGTGINIVGGASSYVNNMIRLGIDINGNSIIPRVTFTGIDKNTTASNSFYFNSVYIGGSDVNTVTTTNTYCFRRQQTGTDVVRNNIFFNARSNDAGTTNKHFAICINSKSSLTSGFNILYASGTGGYIGSLDGGTTPCSSLTDYQIASAFPYLEPGSIEADPLFTAPDAASPDLHIVSASPAESAGISVSSSSVDFDNNSRALFSPVDIGADAVTGTASDITSPAITYSLISNQYPCGSSAAVALSATIVDAVSGVPTTGANMPRIYFRRSAPSASAWVSAPGSLTSGNGNNGVWNFSVDYNLIPATPSPGDVFQYYVVAQDLAANPVFPNFGSSVFDASTPVFTDNNVNSPVTHPASPSSFSIIALPNNPLSDTVYVGGSDPGGGARWYSTFTRFDGFFRGVFDNGLSGDVTVLVRADISNEDGNFWLYGWTEYCGSDYSITIRPESASLKTMSGSLIGMGLFSFQSCKNVIIDGSFNGSGKYLKFANTYSGTGGSENVTLRYDDCTLMDVRNCIIEGQSVKTGAAGGIIYLASDNTYLTFEDNIIRGAGTNLATHCILSAGASDITIRNNEIANFSNASGGTSTRSYGINIISGYWNGSGWLIEGNSFYNSAVNSTNVQTAIGFFPGSSSNNNIIRGNYIGGSSAQCGSGGSVQQWKNSYSPVSAEARHYGIDVNAGSVTISNNTIKRIWISDPYYSGYIGIYIEGSTIAQVDSNTLGGTYPADFYTDPTNSDIIEVDGGAGATYPGYIYGIWSVGSSTLSANHNTFNYLIQNGSYAGGQTFCIFANSSNPAVITHNNNADYHQEAWGIGYNSFAVRLEPTASASGNIISDNKLATVMINGADISSVSSDGIYVNILGSRTVSGTIANNSIIDMPTVENSGITEGIYLNTANGNSSSNGNWDIYNNMIYLSNPGQTLIRTEIDGIDLNLNSGSTANVSYNSVWIDGFNRDNTTTWANPSTAFLIIPGSSGSSGTTTLRNNVFINTRVGGSPNSDTYHTAIWHTSNSTSGWSSENNLFMYKYHASNYPYGRLAIWYLNAMYNLPTWQGYSLGDYASFNPTWVSTGSNFSQNKLNPTDLFNNYSVADLHISTADGASYKFVSDLATAISVTTDFDSQTRPMDASPDLGADEFAAIPAPVLAAEANGNNPDSECPGGVSVALTSNPSGPSPDLCTGDWEYSWFNGALYWNGTAFASASPVFSTAYEDIASTSVSATTTFTTTARCSSAPTAQSSSSVTVNILAPPAWVSAVIGTPANGTSHHMSVSWAAVSGASGYDLDFSVNGSSWSNLISNQNVTSYDHNAGDNPNVSFYYRVRPRAGTSPCSYYTMATPVYSACDAPAIPVVINPTGNTIDVAVATESPVANPAITTYSIFCTTTAQYVQANGSLGASEVFQSKAQWDTVTVTGLSVNTQYCFYAKAKNFDGDIRYDIPPPVSPVETFTTSANFSTQSGSGPTDKYWSPSSCTSGGLLYYASGGCPDGYVGKSGSWLNYFGCFLRTPYTNCTGYSSVILKFDISNSYIASHIKASPSSSDAARFYMWVETAAHPTGEYINATDVKINGVSVAQFDGNGTWLMFNSVRSCVNVEVSFDLSLVTNLTNILFYLEPDCPYNDSYTFSVALDNISVTQTVPSACATTSSCIAPSISVHPLSQSVCNGASVNFTVTASGASPLAYQWKKGGSNISGATLSSYTINPVSSGDAGNYTVYISNACGNITSNIAVLTVNPRPTSSISGSATVCKGQNVTIPITVTGSGTISGTLSNGTAFSGTAPTINAITSPSSSGSITVATLSDANCTAQAGDKTGSFSVTVNPALSYYASVFYEDFGTGWTLPAGWSSSPSGYWTAENASSSTGYSGASGGSNAVAHNQDPQDVSLLAPPIDFSNYTDGRITFGLRKTAAFTRNLAVDVSLNNFSTIVYTETILNADMPPATTWDLDTINLANYIDHAPAVYIRFRLPGPPESGVGSPNIRIDDVTLSSATPVITPASPVTLCPSGNVTLTSSPGNSYLWSPGNETTQAINVTSAGSYSVQVNGCAVSLTTTVNNGTNSTAPAGIYAYQNPVCSGAVDTLLIVGGSLGTGASWQWYSDACGGTLVGTGSSVTVSPTVTTTYYARAEGYCNTTACTNVTITVGTSSGAPTSINASVNPVCSGSTTLTVSGGSLGSGASWMWYSDACGSTFVGSGSSVSVSPTAATTYYVRAESSCDTTNCASLLITLGTNSTAPVGIYAYQNPICGSVTDTLTVVGGSLGTGASWQWYSGSCGGTPVGSGSSISVSPASTTTYYLRAEGNCNTTACASLVLTVNSAPAAFSVTGGGAYCSGSAANDVGLSGSQNGVTYNLYYESSQLVATLGGNGSPITFGPQIQAGNYTVAADNGCQAAMNGSADVSVYNCLTSTKSVAINRTGAQADTSAMLDISDTISGVLFPRMTDAQRNALNAPDAGLIIYNTTTGKLNFWYSAGWHEIGNSFITSSAGGTAVTYGVAVNNSGIPAAPSAMLDISSTVKGVLVPRTLPGAVYGAAEGSVIFNSNTNRLNYFNGSSWTVLSGTFVSATTGGGSQTADGAAVNQPNSSPAPSAILDVSAQNKALLLPRLTTAQRNNINPATGLIIYNLSSHELQYYNGSAWYSLQ